MSKYVEYIDYADLFSDCMTEAEFAGYISAAEAYIDVITHNRAATATGYKAERVKLAVCAVVGEMAAQNASKGTAGARLASVSNDGYTETYSGAGNAWNESESMYAAAMRWLSGTGLVSML